MILCFKFLIIVLFLSRLLIEMIINFNKPLVAAVNGDALGCGTSILALCDIIYITSKVHNMLLLLITLDHGYPQNTLLVSVHNHQD